MTEELNALHVRLCDIMCTPRTVRTAVDPIDDGNETAVDAGIALDNLLAEMMAIYDGLGDVGIEQGGFRFAS
jgi:hypothetical protein